MRVEAGVARVWFVLLDSIIVVSHCTNTQYSVASSVLNVVVDCLIP